MVDPQMPSTGEFGPGAKSASVYDRRGSSGVTLAVFVDRPHLRMQVRDDALAVGYQVVQVASLEAFAAEGEPSPAAVVLVDCPEPSAANLAVLSRQDLLARERGTQLIVSTSLAGLEPVFGCLDQSRPQVLVDPGPADLALALGRALALSGRDSLRDLAEEDRQLLLRLAAEVSRLATRLDRLERNQARGEPGNEAPDRKGAERDRLESPALVFRTRDEPYVLAGKKAPVLPAPQVVRRMLRQRQQRGQHFAPELFADPAWDMLLDLTAARGERKQVSVTSLCIAARVPATTALRWIGQMTEAGLFQRIEDKSDRRRAFIGLTDKAAAGMAAYFAAIGEGEDLPV